METSASCEARYAPLLYPISSSTPTRAKVSGSLHLTLPSMTPRNICLPSWKNGASPTPTFRHRSNTCEASSRRFLPNFTPSLKAKPDSDCAVETNVIGQYSPHHSDCHVRCGPKMRISSALASRCGLQIESRFFSRSKQTHLNLRRNEIEG